MLGLVLGVGRLYMRTASMPDDRHVDASVESSNITQIKIAGTAFHKLVCSIVSQQLMDSRERSGEENSNHPKSRSINFNKRSRTIELTAKTRNHAPSPDAYRCVNVWFREI
jgi:hypothetical protein